MNKLIEYIKKHRQIIFNYYISFNFLLWAAWQTYTAIVEQNFNFIEASFLAQNILIIILFVIRLPRASINPNKFHQFIAIIAFFSGMLFIGKPTTTDITTIKVSEIIIVISNVLGIITLFNLGRSFGVLISFRKVKQNGLYSIVRHPMYTTDILLRIGYLISHFTVLNSTLFILSTACYVYRAFLEEDFLSKNVEYVTYKQQVKYRFIPYIL
jgi:protein-S-isoprenylcysteine O-methyltransferase Ste14